MSVAGVPRRGIKPERLVVMIPGGFALLAALWAGLLRLGLDLPQLRPDLAMLHGPIMVSGFLGVVISIERAVALRRSWPYVAPICAGVGAVLLIFGVPGPAGRILFLIAALTMLAVNMLLVQRQPERHHVVMMLGSLSWVVGSALWVADRPIATMVPFLAGFLIMTIVGERLELSRIVRPGPVARWIFVAIIVVFCAGLAVGPFSSTWGYRIAGVGLLGQPLWLARYDIARRTVRMKGLTRYMAIAFIAGYVWLAVAGVIWIASDALRGLAAMDAGLHAIFLGFVFSMIFAHAPVIFPAVTGGRLPYRAFMYVPLAILHVSLVIRFIGAAAEDVGIWRLGGVGTEVAIVVFIMSAVLAAVITPAAGVRRAPATTAPQGSQAPSRPRRT